MNQDEARTHAESMRVAQNELHRAVELAQARVENCQADLDEAEAEYRRLHGVWTRLLPVGHAIRSEAGL